MAKDEFVRDEEEIQDVFNSIQRKKDLEPTVCWKGYEFSQPKRIYSVDIPISKFEPLWERFMNWKGSQEDFYFRFVNPYKTNEMFEHLKLIGALN